MLELLTSPKAARLRQIIGVSLGAICLTLGVIMLYLSWLLFSRPENEPLSVFETTIIGMFGTDAGGDFFLFGILFLPLGLVFGLISKLQAREWHGHDHEEMLRLMSRELPQVVKDAQSDTMQHLEAEVLFHRLTARCVARSPKLRQEYAEYLAKEAMVVVTQTHDINRAAVHIGELITVYEPLLAKATDDLGRAELASKQYRAQIDAMIATGQQNQQRLEALLTETGRQQAQLEALRLPPVPSNVVTLTPSATAGE